MKVNWTKNQQRIVEFPGGDLLVAAGAGSGKTAVLTAHIVEKITNPDHPIDLDRLLVVTFTNAAAAEMKERVRKSLEERLEQMPDDENLNRQIGLIPGADISTIHSFCLKLIREQFFRLDLDPGFRLGDPGELQLMKTDLLEELFEEQYEKKEQSFLDFRDMYAQGMSDEKVSALILRLYEYAQSYPYPKQWLKEAITDQDGWKTELLAALRQQTEGLWEQLQEAIDMAVDAHIPAKMISALQEDANGLVLLNRHEELDAYCKALSDVTFVRKPTLNKKEKQDALGAEDSIDKAFEVRDAVKNAVKKLKDAYASCTQDQIEQEGQKAAPMQQEMVRLVELFSERFAQKKRALGICDFSDLEHMALKILYDEEGQPSDAADTYARSYDEILIDEYQDCNLVQEQILYAVSRGRFGEEDCFMVGDVKQSIYGFRQARPDLFLDKYNTYSEEETARKQKIELSTNFRSRSGVLQAINMIFRQIMTKSLGGICYDDHAALNPGAAFPERSHADMELMLLDLRDENQEEEEEITAEETEEEELPDASGYNKLEHEARMVAGRIRDMVDPEEPFMVYDGAFKEMRPARYKDMVILMRSLSSTQEDYVRILKEMGIPVYVENESGYFTSVEVANVLDYLRVLDNPMQDIPLAAVMRSPFGNFDAEELAKIRLTGAGKGCAHTFYACCMASRADDEKLERFFFGLEQYRRLAQFLPIHELLLRILEETGYRYYVGALPQGRKRLLNLDMLVAKARTYEETSYRGLFHFIRYIDRLKRYDVDVQTGGGDDQEVDAVRIMTIHKSKGLEFPIVFLCNMNGQFNKMDLNGAVLLDPRYGIATDIRNAKYRYRTKTLKKTAIRQKQLNGLLEEEMRVLYVAMTRAKELLIITGGIKQLAKELQRWGDSASKGRDTLPLRVLCAANSYLDWIVPAVFAAEKNYKNYEQPGILSFSETELKTEQYALTMRRLTKEQLPNGAALTETEASQGDVDVEQSLTKILTWSYPAEALTTIHAAMSVSELKHAAMEETEEVLMEAVRPKGGGGAERGTAYHRVLELLDFSGVPTDQNKDEKRRFVSGEMERMTEAGDISREDAKRVDVEDIASLLETPLGLRLCAAARRGMLHREQPFLLGVPAEEFAPETGEEEQVLVRGIIDGYFEEDGDVILVDYKTDRVRKDTGASVLTERYREQLVYYKRAIQASHKKKVKQAYLYSFTLGREIEVLL